VDKLKNLETQKTDKETQEKGEPFEAKLGRGMRAFLKREAEPTSDK